MSTLNFYNFYKSQPTPPFVRFLSPNKIKWIDRKETLKRSMRLSSCIIQSHFSRWIPFEHVHVPDWMQTLPGNRYVNDPLQTWRRFKIQSCHVLFIKESCAYFIQIHDKCSIHLSYFVFAKLSFVTDTHCSFWFIWRERNSATQTRISKPYESLRSKTWCVKFLIINESNKFGEMKIL